MLMTRTLMEETFLSRIEKSGTSGKIGGPYNEQESLEQPLLYGTTIQSLAERREEERKQKQKQKRARARFRSTLPTVYEKGGKKLTTTHLPRTPEEIYLLSWLLHSSHLTTCVRGDEKQILAL